MHHMEQHPYATYVELYNTPHTNIVTILIIFSHTLTLHGNISHELTLHSNVSHAP